MEELEALERVGVLDLLAEDVEDGVDELSALGVVALGPVVSGTALAVNKGVGAEEVGERALADEVDNSGLQVDLDRAGDKLAVASLAEVDADWTSVLTNTAHCRLHSPLSSCWSSLPTYLPSPATVSTSVLLHLSCHPLRSTRGSRLSPCGHGSLTVEAVLLWTRQLTVRKLSSCMLTWRMFSQKAVPIWLPAAG